MEVKQGIHLHKIKVDKFKTNRIKIRFSSQLSKENISHRVMVSNLLESANAMYPTQQIMRKKLASLYGTQFTTDVGKRGGVHYLDIDITFLKDNYLPADTNLLESILEFLYYVLCKPLTDNKEFQKEFFELELRNYINYLNSETEDNYLMAYYGLNQLFFQNLDLQLPKIGTLELVKNVTPFSTYSMFEEIKKENQIDIFLIGDISTNQVCKWIESLDLQTRQVSLNFNKQVNFSKNIRKKVIKKSVKQSILELGYKISIQYGEKSYYASLVANGILGGFSHSKLFTEVREKEGLAYTIASNIDIYTGQLRIYAGIDRKNKKKIMQVIQKQIESLQTGKLSDDIVNQTKQLLVNQALLSQDYQGDLIEQSYTSFIFGESYQELMIWIDKIRTVKLEDIQEVMNSINLQAIYFLEGTMDET